ncbi:uncharacterized protein LOC143294823 [Babylonia areolata]|uniref:uncharacterized protein LOC143294823 n=1 Tax=Babylonia areolata TaxID=304850 RepID=UPI003FD49B43
MTSMASTALTTRETNRLHRWAMWRMTVNEGIISCIRDNGTTRVIYPDSSSSSDSLTSEAPDFHEFPFITAEQMSLARKLNLREKYGSNHGLSDDAYFIFGLPRINIGKDIPEVTSTGTRSVYESFSELGEAGNTSPRGAVIADNNGGGLAMTYSELGPTPDAQSLASHNDVEVQRINGYREEGWRNAQPPVPRLNLYSIQEELNNNSGESTTHFSPSSRYPDREITNDYSSSSRYPQRDGTNPYSPSRYPDTETRFRFPSRNYPQEKTTNSYYVSNRYHETGMTNRLPSHYRETADTSTNRYSPNRIQERDTPSHFASNHSREQDEPIPTYSVKEAIDRYESVNRYASTSGPVYTTRQISNRSQSSSDRFNWNVRSPPHSPRQDVYPPFSYSRQNSHSPTRRSYSPSPASPRHNYSPLPTSPTSYSAPHTTYSKQQSYSPLPSSPRKSSFPSGGGGGVQGVGSPGYGNKTRPTRLLSDGETERLKRQAYYDWSTPTNERYMMEFGSPARYS